MKKTYIIPEALTIVLNVKTCILTMSGGDEVGDTTIGDLTKEHAGEDNSTGGKNVWDEEW